MTITAPWVAAVLVQAFGRDRIVLNDEFALHNEIAARLRRQGIAFQREVRMGTRKRPDFMVGDVAVEVKVQGGRLHVLRQLKRYADDPRVGGVVLVTTRPLGLLNTLGGKPLVSVELWKNLL